MGCLYDFLYKYGEIYIINIKNRFIQKLARNMKIKIWKRQINVWQCPNLRLLILNQKKS